MARIRSIHPDACKSEKLDASSAEAERCYWRLQPHCDDDGRAEDDPRLLRSLMFPLSDTVTVKRVDQWLQELHERGLIIRYEVDGKRCVYVTKWTTYQKPQKHLDSKLPPLPEGYTTPTVALSLGVGVGEGVRNRRQRPTDAFEPTDQHRAFGTEHGLNVPLELQHWIAWCEANGKTYERLNAGFTTWLHNAVSFGRGAKPSTVTQFGRPEPQRCPQCSNTGRVIRDGELVACECVA